LALLSCTVIIIIIITQPVSPLVGHLLSYLLANIHYCCTVTAAAIFFFTSSPAPPEIR
jgi:ABC-type transport system involved in multi-copper enzyme maturation permease subunit